MIDKELAEIKEMVKLLVTNERLTHVEGTAKFAKTLALIHNLDQNIAEFMAYAHDIFRDVIYEKLVKIARIYSIEISTHDQANPVLLHGKVAAEFIKRRFNINDDDILTGIAFHTSGFKNFGVYGKVLFLADSLEETRTYPNVEELRELAYKDIDIAYFEVLRNKIIYALSRDLLILPESVDSWNSIIVKRKGGVL
ncbi:bis(5'-nucleosyl)-tetraphosphatase (symmetrical) YqeK [Thermosipho atlanticus]|uniref:bis(5'-nucleosyl)-tetraphosphatase (symmetrical) n=1 Tax=Thermosipho atlanticus DSM 15807 TaxID=1123380 RepID=A0A1M5RVY2_9BACT|nr:bis(5'-nucleosyl)-tetraphosphatase (symmetrical) YqeK [Thermosipho atlanticus]SHH30487.1 putative HD superfamily hydrolase of NAD metabolism [Thermosipho atlanticus DSM 15807]